VLLSKAVPGFLINRLQIALLREALGLVEQGVASIEELDIAVRSSIGRRLSVAGVFEVCDLMGLDVVEAAAANVIDRLDGSTRVSPLIRERVRRGDLGIKNGRGLYAWTPNGPRACRPASPGPWRRSGAGTRASPRRLPMNRGFASRVAAAARCRRGEP
jgi:3-hydroxybutyryl-CoA dehydrogenase